jgi:hypothetical protein
MSQNVDPQEDVVFFSQLGGYKNVGISEKGDLSCRTSHPGFMPVLPKIFAPLLLLDWIIGMAVDTHDPRQK